MGRPYESEIAEFAETYAWSMDASVEALSSSLARITRMPLVAVGSGGSPIRRPFVATSLPGWRPILFEIVRSRRR